MEQPGPLAGRVAIVTGSGQGLGRAMALRLAGDGASVVVADLGLDKARAVAEEIGDAALACEVDVADPDGCRRMVEATLTRFERVDVLVNNAAVFSTIEMRPFDELSPSEWQRVIDVNLSGAFYCAQAVAARMREQRSGRIVNISSSTVLFGRPNYAHYVASKAGLVGLTRALARELGEAGVTVNTVMPGMTLTEVPRPSVTPAQAEQAVAQQAIPSPTTPDDIAAAVAFLASDAAGHMTGQTLVVDGGHQFV